MIKVAFYWHQHQPYYKDNLSGKYYMPWVRLHGIKDYIGMAMLLEGFPKIHQTFNYVPCLLDQMRDYGENNARDKFWELTEISANDLTENDKLYILENFFSANVQNMISIHPRYNELLKKRNFERKQAQEVFNNFSHADFQDLQVWANLSWYHPLVIQKDPLLSELIKKGKGFTKEDKEFVLLKQREVIRQIIPLHKQLQDSKQIEVTTSPYYHPILPLLCNQDSVKVILPEASLPKKRLFAIEDAKAQVERAVHAYVKYFGQRPCGIWPSEGAVSDDIIPILIHAGFSWLASDEDVLACSSGNRAIRDDYEKVIAPEVLYRPHRMSVQNNAIHILFRDRILSNLIGFQYSRYDADTAVFDFVNRINNLKRYTNKERPLIVTIILDGENAWEYYPNNGLDFLTKLYHVIDNDPNLECVRIKDYLEEYPPDQTLEHICPGSWIGHNLATWIGHEEKNTAWDLIEDARTFILYKSEEAKSLITADSISHAWEEIFIAEGSDWFWWLGDDHFTSYKGEYDNLFRLHLKNVYRMLNTDIPVMLDIPISITDRKKPYTSPRGFLDIKVDGLVSNYFEWINAGVYNVNTDMGVVHRTDGQPIQAVYFGFCIDKFFLRIDFKKEVFPQYSKNGKIIVTFIHSKEVKICISDLVNKPLKFRIENRNRDHPERDFTTIFLDKIIELSCSFASLGLSSGMDIEFFIEFEDGDAVIQRIPLRTVFSFSVPSEDFERILWQV